MAIAEPGPASFAALRGALLKGHEPPPLQAVARLASYRWVVVGTVCVGAFMGQVDASLTQMLLPRLERDFHAPLSTVSWVAVAYILTMASFMPIFGRLADMIGRHPRLRFQCLLSCRHANQSLATLARERHRQFRLPALEEVSCRHRRAQRYDLALRAALAAVSSEPLRESAHRAVIEVHLAEGNQSEAVRQFDLRLLQADEEHGDRRHAA